MQQCILATLELQPSTTINYQNTFFLLYSPSLCEPLSPVIALTVSLNICRWSVKLFQARYSCTMSSLHFLGGLLRDRVPSVLPNTTVITKQVSLSLQITKTTVTFSSWWYQQCSPFFYSTVNCPMLCLWISIHHFPNWLLFCPAGTHSG